MTILGVTKKNVMRHDFDIDRCSIPNHNENTVEISITLTCLRLFTLIYRTFKTLKNYN